tara:strand:+ start:1600 stop:1971 length:372 start_codon:yes stop_codon:yes gene_type:complete
VEQTEKYQRLESAVREDVGVLETALDGVRTAVQYVRRKAYELVETLYSPFSPDYAFAGAYGGISEGELPTMLYFAKEPVKINRGDFDGSGLSRRAKKNQAGTVKKDKKNKKHRKQRREGRRSR